MLLISRPLQHDSDAKFDFLALTFDSEMRPVISWSVSWRGDSPSNAGSAGGEIIIPEEILADLTPGKLIDWMQTGHKSLFAETEDVSYLAGDERVKAWCEETREWLKRHTEAQRDAE